MSQPSNVYSLPLRYIDKEGKGYCDALMPSQCRIGCDARGVYKCLGGELVSVEWLRVCDNTRGEYEDSLNSIAEDLYGLSMPNVRSMWFARLRKVEEYWDKVRLRLFVEDEQDTAASIPRTRGKRNSRSVR